MALGMPRKIGNLNVWNSWRALGLKEDNRRRAFSGINAGAFEQLFMVMTLRCLAMMRHWIGSERKSKTISRLNSEAGWARTIRTIRQ